MAHGKLEGFYRTQKGLNLLSKKPEFQEILKSEVKRRCLIPEQVANCVPTLYHTVSKYAHGNDSTIILKAADYAVNEFAALVTFFKLQNTWTDALAWRTEPKEGIEGGIAQDDMEEALGVEAMGGKEDNGEVVAVVDMEEEASKGGIVEAG